MKKIGITGLMGSGKTTLCNELIKKNPDWIYINVDDIRTELLNNEYFLSEISELSGTYISNRKELNRVIYSSDSLMTFYKSVLYEKLFNKINACKETDVVIIEWALLIKDNLIEKLDKLIVINKNLDDILNNVYFSDLNKEEVIKRLTVQEKQFNDLEKIDIPYIIYNNIDETMQFIGE